MSKLEKLANLAVVLVCCTITADLVARRLGYAGKSDGQSRAGTQAGPGAREYAVGEAFPAVSGLTLASDKPSLILFVKDSCSYCTASMPFYQRLAETVRVGGDAVRLIGVCPDATDNCAAYFKRHDIAVERVVGIAPGTATLKVAGTPTLLLVDQGKVASVWRGQLQAEGESEVLEAVMRPRGTS